MYEMLLESAGTPALTYLQLLERVGVAFAAGLILSLAAFFSYSGKNYNKSVIHSLWIMTVASSVIINVIGDNFARAIGLFAVLSMIRFRTTLEDTKDTAIFFFSVAMGIACGIGSFNLVLIGIGALVPLLFFLRYVPLFDRDKSRLRFILLPEAEDAKTQIEDFLKSKGIRYEFKELGIKTPSIDFCVSMSIEKAYQLCDEITKSLPGLIERWGVQKDD